MWERVASNVPSWAAVITYSLGVLVLKTVDMAQGYGKELVRKCHPAPDSVKDQISETLQPETQPWKGLELLNLTHLLEGGRKCAAFLLSSSSVCVFLCPPTLFHPLSDLLLLVYFFLHSHAYTHSCTHAHSRVHTHMNTHTLTPPAQEFKQVSFETRNCGPNCTGTWSLKACRHCAPLSTPQS